MDFKAMQLQIVFTDTYMSMLINDTVDICSPILERNAIFWINMEDNINNNDIFRFFQNCVAAVDGSVQRIPRQSVNQSQYYSGKYGGHCLKIQVAMGPSGRAIDIQGPYKGSVHDFVIFQNTNTKNKIFYFIRFETCNYLDDIFNSSHAYDFFLYQFIKEIGLYVIIMLS